MVDELSRSIPQFLSDLHMMSLALQQLAWKAGIFADAIQVYQPFQAFEVLKLAAAEVSRPDNKVL